MRGRALPPPARPRVARRWRRRFFFFPSAGGLSHHGGAARGPRSPPGRLRRTLRRSRRRRTEVGGSGGGGSSGSRGSSSRALPSAAHAHCAQAALAGPALPADLERPRLPGWALLFREGLVRLRPSARRRAGGRVEPLGGEGRKDGGAGSPIPAACGHPTLEWAPRLRNASPGLFERKTPPPHGGAGLQARGALLASGLLFG